MWIVYALLAAFSAAIVAILIKAGVEEIEPNLGVAVQSVAVLLVAWLVVAIQGNARSLGDFDLATWGYLTAAGIVSALSYCLLFQALKHGEASRVVPLDRLSLLFAIILGGIILKEKITPQVVVGGLLMAGGAFLIAAAKK